MSAATAFEPVVEFPEHSYDAAYIYLAVMAYPEPGAGEVGAPGQVFADALAKYQLWCMQKVKGLAFVRAARGDPKYVGPKKRDFGGALERGLRRIDRRMAAYDFYGSQLITAFFRVRQLGAQAIREGRTEEAFHVNEKGGAAPARAELWEKGTPSPHKMIRASGDHWPDRFALNETGPAADAKQKVKDVNRRGLSPSIPVLHMAHGLAEAAREVGPKIEGWNDRDSFLALLMNAELWIWDAIERAETWRLTSLAPGGLALSPDKMIKLILPRPESAE